MTLVEVYNPSNVQLIETLSKGPSSFGALAKFKKIFDYIALHEIWLKLSRENILFNTRALRVSKKKILIQKEFKPIMKCSKAKMISLQ